MNQPVEIPDRIFVIGAGSAGSALCRSLTRSGHRIHAIASRSASRAQQLAAEIGALQSGTRFERLEEAELVIVAVPDDAIEATALDLADHRETWSGCTAFHLSGALSSSLLDPLVRRGAFTASVHPMVAIRPGSSADVFEGVRFNIEGHQTAVAVCTELVREIGGSPFVVDREIKRLIHLAASITSNYMVTLTAVATELLERAGVPPAQFDDLFRPLMKATVDNIRFAYPAEALTGPVARADIETVRAHLELVSSRFPDYLPLIAGLVSETVRIATKTDKISLEEGEALLNLVSDIIESSRT